MFQGETAITIDDKGRMAVPTAYRDVIAGACGGRLVFTYNPFESGSLYLYPQPVWERVRDQVNALPMAKRTSRFFLVSLVSFGLNSLFVWILTGPLLDGPEWWPVVPMLFVTPFVTFALNRRWVFG